MTSWFNRSKYWSHYAASPLLMVAVFIVTNEDSQQSRTHGDRLAYFPMRKVKVQIGKVLAKIGYDCLVFLSIKI